MDDIRRMTANTVLEARRQLTQDLFTYLAALAGVVAAAAPFVFVRWRISMVGAVLFTIAALWARRACVRGNPVVAMHAFLVFSTALLIPVVAFSAQPLGPTLIFLMALPSYAAVCGRRYAMGLGAVYVTAVVLFQQLRAHGVNLPVVFPQPIQGQATLMAVVIVGLVMPLPLIIHRLEQAMIRLFEELARRTQAEQALEQIRRDREALLDALPDYMFKLDEQGHIEEFRSAMQGEIIPVPGGLLGKRVADVFPADTWATVQAALEEARTQGESRGRITRSPIRSGLRWFELSVVPMPPAPGRAMSYILLARDITERREHEAELRLQSQVLSQIQDHVVITRMDGRIRYANQAVLSHLGCGPQELLGQPLAHLAPAAAGAPDSAAILALTCESGAWRGRVLSADAQQAAKVLDLRTTLVKNDAQRPVALVAVGTDVTQQEQVLSALAKHQEQLEHTVAERTAQATEARREAEAANQAKSVFLATMSHEMRTPLNAVLGHAQLLQRQGLQDAQAHHLGPLMAGARHLLALVNNTLDFSKIEAGELVLVPQDFVLQELLAGALELVEEAAREKGLHLTLQADPLPHALHGDALRIRQCLVNYLGNAVKFTDRGQIRLRVGVEPQPQGDALRLRFEVCDSGQGLTPAQQAQLFQPFHQVDGSATRRHGGTGLGLTVTRRLAQAMGGDAGVSSQPGVGSCFWFTVHVQRARARPQPAQDTPPGLDEVRAHLRQAHAGARVLLVEDDPVNRELFVFMLSDVGLCPELAGNGQEALQALDGPPPALVLMDVQMPLMGGLEATRLLRQRPGLARLPVLGLSANAFESDHQACLDAGMNGFIGKPVEFEEFYGKVLHALRLGAAAL